MSLIGVFVVVMWSFKSLIIPLLIMIPIEVAIFVNMAVPYIVGDTMIFIGYIIVSCIQLGATVDYAILTTNNYLECRKTMDKKEAAIGALNLGIPAILTSGSILTCAGYIVYKVSSVAAIGDLGHLIGRGALISMLFVCSLMPAFLVLFDHILMQNEFERIHLFFKKRRERRHARMKRAARRVAGAVWKGKKPLVDSVTSKRKQFEAETKALEDTEMTETGGSQEKTDSDAEAREKHRRKLRLLGKVRERRKDRKRKMIEKREAGSHEEDH